MSPQRVEHPAHCPLCGARSCITRLDGKWTVHCSSEHDHSDSECEWELELDMDPKADGYVFVPRWSDDDGPL